MVFCWVEIEDVGCGVIVEEWVVGVDEGVLYISGGSGSEFV